MGIFSKKDDVDAPPPAAPIPVQDRRKTGRWMQPGRCPSCGEMGQVTHIDKSSKTAEHLCRSCNTTWTDSEEAELERFENYRIQQLRNEVEKQD